MQTRPAATRRFTTDDARSLVALTAARAVSRGARLWRQRGLGTIFLKMNGLRFFQGTQCIAEFEPDCRFRLPVFEPYWGPTVIGGRPYEPEVVHLLREVRDLAPTFVDCGANWGYYSVLVTSPAFGYEGGVAIEANPTTFARLAENARLNGGRFQCLPFALASRSGQKVWLGDVQHHAVAHVQTDGSRSGGGVEVETITIDDAIARAGLGDRERFVLKIDVEGQELPALEGARSLRAEKDYLIVFEDWAELSFSTTTSLMGEGHPAFYVRTDGRCVAVPDAAGIRAIAAADGPLERPCNFVVVRRDGVFHSRLSRWSTRT